MDRVAKFLTFLRARMAPVMLFSEHLRHRQHLSPPAFEGAAAADDPPWDGRVADVAVAAASRPAGWPRPSEHHAAAPFHAPARGSAPRYRQQPNSHAPTSR